MGASDAERRYWVDSQFEAAAGMARHLLLQEASHSLSDPDTVGRALVQVTDLNASVSRAVLFIPSRTGWQVVKDTAGSPDSLVLPPVPSDGIFKPSRSLGIPTEKVGMRRFWAFTPLHRNGTIIGVLGLSAESQAGGIPGEILQSINASLLVIASVSLIIGVFFFWAGKKLSNGRFSDKFLAVLEAGLVVFLAWSSFSSIAAHSRLQRYSTIQLQHVELAQAISQAMSVVDLDPKSPPIFEAAQALNETSRPWLAESFSAAIAKGNKADIITLLAHQSLVTSEQLKRAREAINESSLTAWQGLVILAAAALSVVALIQSRRGRERLLLFKVEEGEETKAHLDRLTDHMPIGLAAFEGSKLVDSNPAWQALLGPAQAASSADWMKWIHPSDVPKVLKILSAPPGGEAQSQAPLGCRILRPDGRTSHLELRFSLPTSSAKLEGRRLVFALDATEEQEAREALKRQKDLTDEKSKLLDSALDDLEENIGSVVQCLVRAVEAKDPYTAGHSERVAEYCTRMGRHLGLGPFELRILELGALVHDVGKIGIPDDILLKPVGLTKEEFDIIKTHPVVGEQILSKFALFDECMPIIRWHHERLDGTGYPDRLSGEEIPFLVRISSVADAFDAMTSSRAYRKGMEPELAIELLERDVQSGKLDAMSLEALKRSVLDLGVVPQVEPSSNRLKAA